MTTTELIKILKDNECGGVTHKPRELSLTINGKYMPNPQITLSSTGDGFCGAEIDLDVDGEFYEEQELCEDCISREWLKTAIHNFYNGLMHTPTEEDIQAYLDVAPSVQPKLEQEPETDRLYSYLNDMRFGISPDETTPPNERPKRLAQIEIIDCVMEWIEKESCNDYISKKKVIECFFDDKRYFKDQLKILEDICKL